MKNIWNNIIILCFIVILGGCDDGFLDRTPYTSLAGNTIWTSDANATMGINGLYHTAHLNGAGTAQPTNFLHGYCFYFSTFGPDGFNYFRNSEMERNTATNRTGFFINAYQTFYKIIRSANDAIYNLEGNKMVTPDLATRMIGEAKFFRGISYLYLWNLFGGVIILDKPVLPSETYLPRNTADEVKEQAIKDLTDAIGCLPVEYPDNDFGRITKGAATAMLGKVYLYDEQWDKAAEQFGKLLSSPFSYELVPEYWQLFDYKYEKNKEVIYSLQMVDENGQGSCYDQLYGGRSTFTYAQSFSMASHIPFHTYTYQDGTAIDLTTRPKRADYDTEYNYGLDLMAWYEETLNKKPVDKRLQGNIIMPTDTFIGQNNTVFQVYWPYVDYANATPPAYRIEFSGYAIYSWRKLVNTGNENQVRWESPTDIPIVRFADVLLMYAEAKNEQSGPTQEVYDVMNRVRTRAGLINLPEGLSREEMRRYIRLERYHEFPGEGHLFFDVRRWRTAHTDDPVFGLNHDVLDFRGETLFQRSFSEKYYLWPIPEAEREINGLLTQNPGWE